MLNSAPSPSPKLQLQPRSVPVWRQLFQGWDNLSLRSKLTLLLMSTAAVPVIAVTQVLVVISQERMQNTFKETLRAQQSGFVNEYVFWAKDESEWQASTIAKTVEATRINLQNPKLVEANRPLLQTVVSELFATQDRERPETYKSFRIITDAQGKTVVQYIQIHEDYPSGTSPKGEEIIHPVSLPTGINLGDVPIIKNALSTGRTLSGVELLPRKFLQQLGLDKQATVPLRPQPIQGLPESEQPFPEGTYPDIDKGRTGLFSMAVQPIKVQGKVVGVAVVGVLLNQNHILVDLFAEIYNPSAVSVIAQDLQVNTTVPYGDSKTRATGTQVAREVAEVVLNQGQEFLDQTNILGRKYLAAYSPLYDHQKELNPTGAKPVGMASVGITLEEIEGALGRLQLIGYSIGAGILLLAGVVAVPIAGTLSRPIRRLAGFAQQVAEGEQGVRLEATSRGDEIGVLSQELNKMAASIETNLEARRQEAERVQLLADIAASRAREFQDLEYVFKQAVQGAQQILKAERVFLYRFNSDWSGSIVAEAVAPGCPSCLNIQVTDTYFTESEAGVEKYKNGRICVIDDIYKAGLTDCHVQLYEQLRIKANVIMPIVKSDQLIGLICTQQCSSPRAWQQSEVNFLTQLAAQLGLILDRVAFLEQKEAEAERAQLTKEITLRIGQSLNLEDILNTAVQEIRLALKTDRVLVYGFNEKSLGTVTAESVAAGWPSALGAEINDPCFRNEYVERYRRGRVRAIENIYSAGLTECHLKQLETFAVKADLVAPILQGGQLFGLLIAHQCSAPRAWQQGEIDVFTQLATQIGFALDRGSLLEQVEQARQKAEIVSQERANLLEQVEQARQKAEIVSQEQRQQKEALQKRALELLTEVDPISKGDLTIHANVTYDEIGTVADSYNATVSSLRKIVTTVQAAAKQVAATTSSSDVSVSELSKEALRQAQEIAAALDQIQEMSNSIRAVAASAQQAQAAVQQATHTVEAGDAAMNRTVDGILAIRETVAQTSKKVKRLGESSQKISRVVNLISTFAAQTNLLAFNASIEAARAGKEGRGFAIVADEVRSLARQSAQATAEIENLITTIQIETSEVVAAMEAGTEQVVEGTYLVNDTRTSLNQITTASAQISALVSAIADSAVAQSQAAFAVTQTMSDVAAIAQHNSTEATLVSASFKELLTLAKELLANVGQFKVS